MSGGLVSAVNKCRSHYVRNCSKRIEEYFRLWSVPFSPICLPSEREVLKLHY